MTAQTLPVCGGYITGGEKLSFIMLAKCKTFEVEFSPQKPKEKNFFLKRQLYENKIKIKSTIKHCNASCMMSNTCGILQERNKNGEY